MRLKRSLDISLLLPLLLGLHQAIAADDPAPNFTGTVADQTKAPVPKAHIWIHEWSGGPSFEAKPDAKGTFATMLPNGYYEVMVGSPGFQPVSKSIRIDSGKSIKWQISLCADTENMQDTPDPGPSPKQCSRIVSQ
jgi:Carboxypeptidase regulatory-like domain